MINQRLLCFLAGLGIAVSMFAQSGYETELASATSDEIIAGINRYDSAAIREAGRRQDRRYLPQLRRQLTNLLPGYDANALRLALARFDDRRELQRIVCEIDGPSPRRAYDAWGKLSYVQGSFSISLLETLLDKKEPRDFFSRDQLRRYEREFGDDEILRSPRDVAIVILPRVVPDPPYPPILDISGVSTAERQRLAEGWKQWLASHRDSVARLGPVGRGVDFSGQACRAGKPKTK